jgi:hypothetical protein
VNTENEKAVRDPIAEAIDLLEKSADPFDKACMLLRAALQSQVSNTDVLEKIVKVADEQPFCSIGHIVEHVVPEIRDALAAPKAPQQVSNTTQDGEAFDHTNMDSAYWAGEFCKAFPGHDEGLMMSWFANAIMCGWDNAHWRMQKEYTPPQQQEQSREATLVYALRAARPFVVLCDNCGDEGRKETLKLIDAAIGNDSSPATPTATASQESVSEQEAVAEVVGVSMLGDNAPLAKHIQTLPGKSVEIGDKLFPAPPSSTAIVAMVIRQAAEKCEAVKVSNSGSRAVDAVHNGAVDDCIKAILALTSANAESELEALMKDAERLDWIEDANTLHQQTEFLYVVDGYELHLVNDRIGDAVFHGETVRAVIDAAINMPTNGEGGEK